MKFHQVLENRFLIVPGLPGKYRESPAAWMETAKLFNGIAEKLKPFGMYCKIVIHLVIGVKDIVELVGVALTLPPATGRYNQGLQIELVGTDQ